MDSDTARVKMSHSSKGDGNPGVFKRFYHRFYYSCNILLMIFVTVFLGFFTMFFLDVWTNHGHTTVVPEVRKKPYSEAVKMLKDKDLEVEIADSIYDTKMPPGAVKEVWPHPNTTVKPGRTVYLTINAFQPKRVTVSMPLSGVSSRQAVTYLESLNCHNITIKKVPSNFPDLVVAARYKGKNIVPGMQIPVTAEIILEVGDTKQGSQKPNAGSSVNKAEKQDETLPEPETNPEPEGPAPEVDVPAPAEPEAAPAVPADPKPATE